MRRNDKIKTLEELVEVIASSHAQNDEKKIAHTHGVFDVLHIGHIRHFEQARELGDILVVTVTPDRYVNKELHRSMYSEDLRAEAIAALDSVDYVAINEWPSAVEVIHQLRPDVFVESSENAQFEGDQSGKLEDKLQAVLSVGGRIHLTEDIAISSSHLSNNYIGTFPSATEKWLKAFRKRYSLDEVIQYLDGAASIKALVVGEAIIDEYVFCDGLGKATKDPILAVRYTSKDTYAGGSLAVANHLAGFCDHVGLITLLGDSNRREQLVRRALLSNVQPYFVTRKNSPTIHKRRFIDTHTNARMFELYVMEDTPLEPDNETALVQALSATIDEYDIVVVADYGHGMLAPGMIASLCDTSRFLAINTQANAGNRGFNTISKYPTADYVCLAGHEVSLETRMRHASWRELVREVIKKIDCPRFTVTRGKDGTLHYGKDFSFTEVPALATKVTDRVGAGDAVLAVSSLLVAQGAPWDIVGFVCNLAGAQMVAELGNRMSVNKTSVASHASSLMSKSGKNQS